MDTFNVSSFVDDRIRVKKVVVFSKTWCPYCNKAKEALSEFKSELGDEQYEVVELDTWENQDMAEAVLNYLKQKTGARSVPRVFIDGECIGGGDETVSMKKSGQLGQRIRNQQQAYY